MRSWSPASTWTVLQPHAGPVPRQRVPAAGHIRDGVPASRASRPSDDLGAAAGAQSSRSRSARRPVTGTADAGKVPRSLAMIRAINGGESAISPSGDPVEFVHNAGRSSGSATSAPTSCLCAALQGACAGIGRDPGGRCANFETISAAITRPRTPVTSCSEPHPSISCMSSDTWLPSPNQDPFI